MCRGGSGGSSSAIWTATVALELGVVRLDVTADGHELTDYGVIVDGEPVRADPAQGLELGAGRHLIEVSAPDHRTTRELVEVERGGETREIGVELLHEQDPLNIEVEPSGGRS